MAADELQTTITVRAVGPSDWDEVVDVFGTRGGSSWCWCQFFLTTGSGYEVSASANRAALHEQMRSHPPAGLLARRGEVPVGWVQVGPIERYPRATGQARRRGIVGEDPPGLWRITCFVVPPRHRRTGVATALLSGAIAHTRAQGARVVEGHPVDTAGGRRPGSDLYHGVLSTFLAAGFTEVGRTTPNRPIVRLELAP